MNNKESDSQDEPPDSFEQHSPAATWPVAGEGVGGRPLAPSSSTASTCINTPSTTPTIVGPVPEIRQAEIGVTESVIASVGQEKSDAGPCRCAEKLEAAVEGDVDEKCLKGEEPVEDYYPDGGFRAWKTVAAVFLLVCCTNGYALSWGLFASELKRTTQKDVPISVIHLSNGLCSFVVSCVSFVAGRLADKYGYKRVIAASIICTFLSLVASAFVSFSLAGLFLVQGALLGFSQGLGMAPMVSLPSMWFFKRRGFATGLAASGGGVGGCFASLIVRAMLPRFGYSHTLLIYASINLVVQVAAWCVIEVREIESVKLQNRTAKSWLPKGVWHDSAWYSLMGCLLVGFMGFLSVFFYITPYTQLKCPKLDPSSLQAAVPLIIANLMSAFGRIFAGLLCDRLGPVNTLCLSFFLGGFFQLSIWPNAQTFGTIVAFGALYGFVASWFFSLMPVVCAQLFGMGNLAAMTGFGMLMTGPGQFAGAPVAGTLLSSSGGNYNYVAFYSGSLMIGGSACLLIARFGREKRVFKKF